MGVSRFLKSKSTAIEIIGLQPLDGAQISGITRWPAAYLPDIYRDKCVDRLMDISQSDSEAAMHWLAQGEGIFSEAFPGWCHGCPATYQQRGGESHYHCYRMRSGCSLSLYRCV